VTRVWKQGEGFLSRLSSAASLPFSDASRGRVRPFGLRFGFEKGMEIGNCRRLGRRRAMLAEKEENRRQKTNVKRRTKKGGNKKYPCPRGTPAFIYLA
jgi:hypothetical protein